MKSQTTAEVQPNAMMFEYKQAASGVFIAIKTNTLHEAMNTWMVLYESTAKQCTA